MKLKVDFNFLVDSYQSREFAGWYQVEIREKNLLAATESEPVSLFMYHGILHVVSLYMTRQLDIHLAPDLLALLHPGKVIHGQEMDAQLRILISPECFTQVRGNIFLVTVKLADVNIDGAVPEYKLLKAVVPHPAKGVRLQVLPDVAGKPVDIRTALDIQQAAALHHPGGRQRYRDFSWSERSEAEECYEQYAQHTYR